MRTIVWIATLVACMYATTAQAQKDWKTVEYNTLGDFTSLDFNAVGTIYFTQGDQCTVKVEGSAAQLEKVKIEVREGTLRVTYKDDKGKNNKKLVYYVQAPTLYKLDFNGVGSFRCDQPLNMKNDVRLKMNGVGNLSIKEINCQNLSLYFDGVGSVDVNLNCQNLTVDADGVGSVKLTGTAATGQLSKDGVGGMNTKQLKIGK